MTDHRMNLKPDLSVADLARELGDIPIADLVRFIRDIRDDREMRPRLKAVHPHTVLNRSQAEHIRMLDRNGAGRLGNRGEGGRCASFSCVWEGYVQGVVYAASMR